MIAAVVLMAIEMLGPLLAETRKEPTPWHPPTSPSGTA